MNMFNGRRVLASIAGLALIGGAHAGAAPDAQGFVNQAAQAGMMEVEAAKAAQKSGSAAAVKEFAERMITDHGKANTELAGIARSKGLQVPARLDAHHQQMVQSLSGKSGTAFDAAYAAQMVSDHEKAVALFEAGSKLSDPEVAAFAAKTLPILREHKRLADDLAARQKK